MITVSDFEKLNLDQKAFKLSDEGMLLQSMKSNNTFLSLYYFPRFFVEVAIDVSKRKITEIKAFKDDSRLEKYLDNIELSLW
jgi:hypothetical protein